jgi:hypothetical protein
MGRLAFLEKLQENCYLNLFLSLVEDNARPCNGRKECPARLNIGPLIRIVV